MVKYRKRRALATIVTTGIFLSVVAIMGSMMTAWSNSIFANEKHEINTVYSDGVNKLNEFLVVEHVWFGQGPPKFLNVTIANVGNVGLNVTKITLDNSVNRTDVFYTDGGLIPNDFLSRKINYTWTTTDPIQLTVTTEKGSLYQTFVMGP